MGGSNGKVVAPGRVAEVAREHGWHPPKSLDLDENFKPEVMDIEYKQKHGQYVNDKHCQPYLKPLHVNVVHVQKSPKKWTEWK